MKAAIYCRLSEEDKNKTSETDDSKSIQNQKNMLIQYAFEHGWEVYNIYSDDDYTGADRKRPEFNKLLEDAEAHKFEIILCKTQSRFTRELELVEKYIHGLFPIWGIRFVSIVDNADTDNKGNKKSRQINGLVNEWYLEDMSDNIKSVLTNRRENGFHIGAFALYGYKKDPDKKGHLVIDEEAAAVVREVFNLFAQGYGKTAIARMLNDRGIPNPTEYKRQKGLRYKGAENKNSTLWKYSAISGMLINEMYIGNMVQGKYGSVSYKTKVCKPRKKDEWYRVEGTHEPIIDKELWDRVQHLIGEKAKPFITGSIGLFSRKVMCGYCHYTMRSSKHRNITNGKPDGKRFLQCETRFISRDACPGAFIGVAKLERYVLDELHKLSERYLDTDMLEDKVELSSDLEENLRSVKNDIESYKKKSDEFGKGIRELYLDKVRGIIKEEEYVEMADGFRFEKERMDKLMEDAKQTADAIQAKIDSRESKVEILKKYASIDKLTREMVDELIDYIYVFKRIEGTRNIPIEIHWNF